MPTLYSLYRLYGKRWVRVGREQLSLGQAKRKWASHTAQLTFMGMQYSIRPIPKSEIRRQILEQYNSKKQRGKT